MLLLLRDVCQQRNVGRLVVTMKEVGFDYCPSASLLKRIVETRSNSVSKISKPPSSARKYVITRDNESPIMRMIAIVLVAVGIAVAQGVHPVSRVRRPISGDQGTPIVPGAAGATFSSSVIDVRTKGAVCDNLTNDYNAIQIALSVAPPGGGVYFPSMCATSSPLSMSGKRSVTLYGSALHKSGISYTGSIGIGLSLIGAGYIGFHDFTINTTNSVHPPFGALGSVVK